MQHKEGIYVKVEKKKYCENSIVIARYVAVRLFKKRKIAFISYYKKVFYTTYGYIEGQEIDLGKAVDAAIKEYESSRE